MLHLLRDYDMPVFMNTVGDYNIRVLLDTGANLSVFNGSEDDLSNYFENVKKTEYSTIINGFGGKTHVLPIYKLQEITVDNTTIYNVLLVSLEFDMAVDLILAGTLLKLNSFRIHMAERLLEVESIGRDVYCVPVGLEKNDNGEKSIRSTTVFLRDK